VPHAGSLLITRRTIQSRFVLLTGASQEAITRSWLPANLVAPHIFRVLVLFVECFAGSDNVETAFSADCFAVTAIFVLIRQYLYLF
jgi:hypothetical protein